MAREVNRGFFGATATWASQKQTYSAAFRRPSPSIGERLLTVY